MRILELGEKLKMPEPPRLTGNWQWAMDFDKESGEYGVFSTGGNEINLPQDGTVVTAARIILNNSFALLPVCGYSYGTAQYMGRGPTEFSFQLAGVGDYHLSRIQAMHEELEKNAREFRKISGAAMVEIGSNEFLKLAGIKDGIISSIDTETDSQGTNLFRMQMSFTSEGHHMETLNQERYVSSQDFGPVLNVLLSKMKSRVVSRPAQYEAITSETSFDITSPSSWALSIIRGSLGIGTSVSNFFLGQNRQIGSGVRDATDLESLGEALFHNVRGRANSLGRYAEDLVETGGDFSAVARNEANGQYLEKPILTPVPNQHNMGILFTAPALAAPYGWLYEPMVDLQNILQAAMPTLPGFTFFQTPMRGKYWDARGGTPSEQVFDDFDPVYNNPLLLAIMYGTMREWVSIDELRGNLRNFYAALLAVAQRVAGMRGEEGFDSLFPGVTQTLDSARDVTVHPTYQDIELPPHPSTHNVIDTNPDFYFFNDSEQNLLNEVGPDLINEMDTRINNAEYSFTRLNSGDTWSSTYLGRNRIAIDRPGVLSSIENTICPSQRHMPMDGGPDMGLGINNEVRDQAGAAASQDRSRLQIGGGLTHLQQSAVDNVIGLSSTAKSGSDVDLQTRRAEMIRRTTHALPAGNPTSPMMIGPVDNALTGEDTTHSFSKNYVRQAAMQAIIQNPDTTLTMRRAFPSFKLYFLEDDIGAEREHLLGADGSGLFAGLRNVMYFDDFYNYNSVKEIRLIRSRKNPSDLLVVVLTNVTGLLERRRWKSEIEREYPTEIYAPGFEETELENPLKKLVLKEGLKVQLRLGYDNHPSRMNTKFIGEVVEVSFNAESSDEVTIICQSYGAELTLEPKGVQTGQRTTFTDTPDLLHTMLCSPELVHFGRFDLNPEFNPSEARSTASSRQEGVDIGLGIILSPQETIDNLREVLCKTRTKWFLANNPADDNIFAPAIRDYQTQLQNYGTTIADRLMFGANVIRAQAELVRGESWTRQALTWVPRTLMGFQAGAQNWLASFFSDTPFEVKGQTVWDIIKECELRHPGWIGHPRPYGTRMTMFFGVPNFRYWADEISPAEMTALDRMRTSLQQVFASTGTVTNEDDLGLYETLRILRNVAYGEDYGSRQVAQNAGWIAERTWREIYTTRYLSDVGAYLGRTMGRYRPFRRFHLITSDHHIIANNIRASDKGTFNAVQLKYGGSAYYTMKADDSIPDERTIVGSFEYPSCNSEVMARRYCIGLLMRHLKDIYKGEIIVIGMDIDPLDQIYLHDSRSDMHGPAEVEQVVDTFTPETGWITEITPDLISVANEWSTISTRQAREAVFGALIQRYAGLRMGEATQYAVLAAGLAALGVTSGVLTAGAYLAWCGGYEIIRWTQDRQPLIVVPLIYGERPFIAGLDGFRQDGVFASLRSRVSAEIDNVEQGWRSLHLSGYLSDITITAAQSVAGQGE
jgi:hypothetical protein